MSNKPQKPLFASGLYIALSLCLLAVVCIGAYSAVNQLFQDTNARPELESNDKPLVEIPSTVKPQTQSPAPVITPDDTEEEEVIEDTDTVPEAEVSTEPQEAERIYLSPIENGAVQKEFKIDELVYSDTMNDYRAHTGIDISAAVGTPVRAFTDGVIESVHADPLMGQTLVINHGDGLKSVYQNLALEMPEGMIAGMEVKSGDLVGAVGETAIIECAEESHLHFELLKDDGCINPQEYLK